MRSAANFPIVGVGASAGGIEALQGFFGGVTDAPGLAFVIVTHLSPDHESLLHEIIERCTPLPVVIAADGQRVEKNHVYVLSADAILGLKNGQLQIHTQNTGHRERKPIDVFLSSLAEDQGELCAGVILSGADADGTLGVKAIKENGGLTLAQTAGNRSPRHAEMPESAIATGVIDLAIPVEEMGAKLIEFARSAYVLDSIAFGAGHDEVGQQQFEGARTEIYDILHSQIGHDFSGYKTKTFLRRVQRRMQVMQINTIEAYVDFLRRESQEVGALFRDLLISVTNFFRDTEAFEALAECVIPKLFEGRGADEIVRVWIPGCATGEEVYSLAILMCEYMASLDVTPRVQIFATDIDDRALSVARAARYPTQLLDGVSSQRRERFFLADAGCFVVAKEVRDLCIFSPHSVIRDPPFSRIDLVSCRNLLIYFGLDVQSQVIPIFHYALRPHGYLFLGTSESVSQFDELFTPVKKKQRIFQRRSGPAAHMRPPLMMSLARAGQAVDFTPLRAQPGGVVLRQLVDTQVLERFAPPHVVVNQDGDVAYYSARTGKYLEAAPGVPTRQVFAMARKGLRLELRTLFREALESGRMVTRDSVAIEEDDGRVQLISLTVEPLSNGGDPLFLILFADQGPALSREDALNRAHTARDGTAIQTERELRETRERLQSVIEEYETALEELKSSNEELVSVNEELQSTNEELEASKEELVSLNEELHTVNAELNGKVDALDRANSDLQNLFDSTAVATVFLDERLVIRSFTPAMADVFNIRQSDRGRPITDLASRLNMHGFQEDIARVFNAQEILEQRVVSEDGARHYLVRLAPYRDSDQKTDGVVATFVDISVLTLAQSRQQVLIAELQHRTRNLLTVVQSMAQQTLGSSAATHTFAARLAALGRLQGLIGEETEGHVDLSDIVRLELEAHGAPDDKVTRAGPSVPLGLDCVQAFALALHELATNAVKYGALKGKPGRLDIQWCIDRSATTPRLVLDWRESGLETPPDDSRRGYGRQLIEQALTFTLQAKTELTFGSDGVSCRIEMPLSRTTTTQLNTT